MIDILCILLIFFVATTTFKKFEPEMKINLPESGTAKPSTDQEQKNFLIYATEDKRVLINEQPSSIEKLEEDLRKTKRLNPKAFFALKADENIPLSFFVKILDATKNAGIEDVAMLTEPLNDPNKTQ
jgi:biopolymer transport protein ExbD